MWKLIPANIVGIVLFFGFMNFPVSATDPRDDKLSFEKSIASTTTAFGVPIFDRVQIRESNIYLWLASPEFLAPNLSNFAKIGDDFANWCGCQAVTNVGLDYTHLGSGEHIIMKFVYDPEKRRSVRR